MSEMHTIKVHDSSSAGEALAAAAHIYSELNDVPFADAFKEVCSLPSNAKAVQLYLDYSAEQQRRVDEATQQLKHTTGNVLDYLTRSHMRENVGMTYPEAFLKVARDPDNAKYLPGYLRGDAT